MTASGRRASCRGHIRHRPHHRCDGGDHSAVSAPVAAGDYTFTCSGSGCALAADTTYFVRFSSADTNNANEYRWKTVVDAFGETAVPADNGWTLADELDYRHGGNAWTAATDLAGYLKVTAETGTYWFGLRAANAAGPSAWNAKPVSPSPLVAPAAPTGVAATAGDTSLTLSWDDPGDGSITGYEYNVNHNATYTGNFTGWSAWQPIPNSGADTRPHTNCQGPVSGTTQTLSGLTGGTSYT